MTGHAWDKLIADARDEALEEAAQVCDGVARIFGPYTTKGTVAGECAIRIRSLKSQPEQENENG